jgi:hypothetical protein
MNPLASSFDFKWYHCLGYYGLDDDDLFGRGIGGPTLALLSSSAYDGPSYLGHMAEIGQRQVVLNVGLVQYDISRSFPRHGCPVRLWEQSFAFA